MVRIRKRCSPDSYIFFVFYDIMRLEKKDYGFVGIQLALFILYLIDVKLLNIYIHEIINKAGLVVAIIGALIALIALLQLKTNLSPFPSPKSNTSLIQNGIYKFIRHPIYTGIILTTFGYGLFVGSFYKIIISIVLYILFIFKSRYEEERLELTFLNYKDYKKRSGRFFPKI